MPHLKRSGYPGWQPPISNPMPNAEFARELTVIEQRIEVSSKLAVDLAALGDIVGRYEIKALVIGLPLNMDGSGGPRVQATRAFARNLAVLTPIPILFEDERLTTAAAAEKQRHPLRRSFPCRPRLLPKRPIRRPKGRQGRTRRKLKESS